MCYNILWEFECSFFKKIPGCLGTAEQERRQARQGDLLARHQLAGLWTGFEFSLVVLSKWNNLLFQGRLRNGGEAGQEAQDHRDQGRDSYGCVRMNNF